MSFNTENYTFIDFKEIDNEMSKQVWEYRNLHEIRKWMVNSEIITWENHVRFIQNLIDNRDTSYYYIVYQGHFIGSINVRREANNIVERGIYIIPQYWGQKHSKQVCNEFYSYLKEMFGVKAIRTKVLKQNIASNALENSLGAIKTSEDKLYYYYTRKL